jgi:nucleoid DNA-binding protein
MCAACVTTYLMLITADTVSIGGLAEFAAKKSFSKPDRNPQTNEPKERPNEN